jgi:DNA invertase Pin-like site-specific DNA recombinase
MKVHYSRVSTLEQNEERQLKNTDGCDYVLVDKCSGLIPLWERPQGSQIKKLIDNGKLKHLSIHSIDRLGRSTLDVLNVWKELTEKGIIIECRNPSLRNLNDSGKPDMFSELMISILSTMSSFEKSLIYERQMEGIRIRKEKGLYQGRQIGTTESKEKFLEKPKNQKILKYLNSGYTYDEIRSIMKCSPSTISKVLRIQEEISVSKENHLSNLY